ncbi:MAG TPA: DinB family protein [Pedobacter sp.]|nr:DinB family protein [Pedobacter sp.]
MNRPQAHEYSPWGETYIKLVDEEVIGVLGRQVTEFADFINSLVEKADYAYAPGKWTIKEVFGHIIDTERILVYRLTCIARGEKQSLPNFEEDDYVAGAHFSDRSLLSLSHEFALLRKANLYLFKSLTEPELDRIGIASNRDISVRALLYIVAGHIIHHVNVIRERYL